MQLCHCCHHNAPDLQHLTFFQVKRGIVFISGFEGILAVLDAQLLVGQDDDRQTLQAWVEGPFTGDIEGRIQIQSATPVDSMNEGGVLRAVDQQFSVHSQW